jgi:phosphoenolpyruvate---glycerone phosphotransferase subunit DhaL
LADTAADVARWVRAFQAETAEHKDRLIELDAAIGDADHGANMDRGMRAVVAKLDTTPVEAEIGGLFKTVGMTLVSTVGGAAGPLYGTLFLRMATAVAGRAELDGQAWATALEAGVGGVQDRGRAVPGDKTMVDALLPAVAAFRATVDRGGSTAEAWHRAAVAARAGVKATIPMVARKGRASYLGERSAGHQDPGATSSYLLVKCGADVLGGTPSAAGTAASEESEGEGWPGT